MSQLTVNRTDRRPMDTFTDLERWLFEGVPTWFGPTTQSFPVDVSETDDAYLVEVDAPGVTRDDLEITLERNQLTIGVNARTHEQESSRRYIRRERSRMHASRSIRFPTAIDADGVTATFDGGVLRVTAPKSASDKARRIDIS